MPRIVLGTDHRGFVHKEHLIHSVDLLQKDIEWLDVGAHDAERSDYPVYAHAVCNRLYEGHAQLGILLCGTGIGMAIAANRQRGIRAGVAWSAEIARRGREEDNINILVLPADYVAVTDLDEIVVAWLTAKFLGERYQERIDMIDPKE